MKKLVLILMCVALLGACATALPPSDPVCERSEFSDSWICSQLKASGVDYAEVVNDLILDANDISLIMEVYTVDQLEAALERIEGYLEITDISYAVLLRNIMDDTSKAARIGSIIKRRFNILNSVEIVRDSDRELVRMAIQNLRDSV